MKKSLQYQRNNIGFFIRENSWIAQLAAWKLRSHQVAITIGKTVHLWRTDIPTFLSDEKWVKHELCHVRQFQRYGFSTFIIQYIIESLKKGYYQNKFEVEAREAENEEG